jgi:hypothetical protein
MEDADRRLFISEGWIPTIGWNNKEADDHEGRRMESSRQKGTRNDTDEPDNVSGFQYFKIKDNEGVNGPIG